MSTRASEAKQRVRDSLWSDAGSITRRRFGRYVPGLQPLLPPDPPVVVGLVGLVSHWFPPCHTHTHIYIYIFVCPLEGSIFGVAWWHVSCKGCKFEAITWRHTLDGKNPRQASSVVGRWFIPVFRK